MAPCQRCCNCASIVKALNTMPALWRQGNCNEAYNHKSYHTDIKIGKHMCSKDL